MGAAELAIEGGFVAEQQVEDAGGVGVEIDESFLNAPDAHHAPAGDGHGFDQQGLGGVGRLEFGGECRKEPGEALLGFAFEDDGLSEHAVAGAVAGGVAFAGGGDWSAGSGAVGAGGLSSG